MDCCNLSGRAGSNGKLKNYYFANSINLGTTWIDISGAVNLCLNGYDIESRSTYYTVNVNSGSTVNITDCEGTRKIKNTSSGKAVNASVWGENIIINFYDGTIQASTGYAYYNSDAFENCVFNQYGGKNDKFRL